LCRDGTVFHGGGDRKKKKRKMGDDVVIYVIWIDGRKLLAECVYFYLGGAGVSWHRNKKEEEEENARPFFFLPLSNLRPPS
jgi:hypothetical protein